LREDGPWGVDLFVLVRYLGLPTNPLPRGRSAFTASTTTARSARGGRRRWRPCTPA